MNIPRPQKPYVFHPPKYSPWLMPVLHRVAEHFYMRRKFKIREVRERGIGKVVQRVGEGHSVLVAPNHADHADPSLLLHLGKRHRLPFHFMAAREGFERGRLAAAVLQRCGAFSVDREGADLAAIKMAMSLLQACRYPLVIFPEGEIWHHHESLDALNDGVATILLRAAAKLPEGRKAFLVPAAIRIGHDPGVEQSFSARLSRLEQRVLWKPRPERNAVDRIHRLGAGLLALKEEEHLGRAQTGSLPERIAGLREALVTAMEEKHAVTPDKPGMPERIKLLRGRLRKHLLDGEAAASPALHAALYDDLDTLYLASQLYSYPGQYLRENPSLDRVAETILKLEEDVLEEEEYVGPRCADVSFDEPVDVAAFLESRSLTVKTGVRPLTQWLGERIQALIDAGTVS